MYALGFVVNPIAGMGGRVGLKGTDNVFEEAVKRGATPISGERALQTLKTLIRARDHYHRELPLHWYTVSGDMGENVLRQAGFTPHEYTIVSFCSSPTTKADTHKACTTFEEKKVDLIVFCGGDGTARDVYGAVDARIPMVGIPAGVKMHSGVFGVNPESVAEVILAFMEGTLHLGEVEIMDLDEEKYRKGEWNIQLHGIAQTPFQPTYIQSAKAIIQGPSEEDIKKEIAHHLIEEMDANTLYILGSGSTLKAIGEALHVDKTLLGIDAVFNKKLVAQDADEKTLLQLCDQYRNVKLIVSPIGAQGFILGRGNLQLSPQVIKKIGIDNIVVVATPAKLMQLDTVRVDTQDQALDTAFREKRYLRILIGYHTVAVRTVDVP